MPTTTQNTEKRRPGRPRKVDALSQINGKVETQKDISEISTLEEAWGNVNPLSAYGTISEESYAAKLRNMTNSELESHAREKGVMFTNSLPGNLPYERLRTLLLKEFRAYAASLNRPTHKPAQVVVSEQVRKILAEGR